jgi:hypothetical protein
MINFEKLKFGLSKITSILGTGLWFQESHKVDFDENEARVNRILASGNAG